MKVLSASSKEGLEDDDACGELKFFRAGDSTHCHSYNSNMDGFVYLDYNC